LLKLNLTFNPQQPSLATKTKNQNSRNLTKIPWKKFCNSSKKSLGNFGDPSDKKSLGNSATSDQNFGGPFYKISGRSRGKNHWELGVKKISPLLQFDLLLNFPKQNQ